jgi:hypothetical protein
MRNDLPNDKASNFNARMRETVMTYLGKQGDPLDRGVTLRDLVESGIVELSGGRIGSGPVPLTPGEALGPVVNDLTPPPAPSGFGASAGIATVIVEHDNPAYNWGNGHLRTRLYGKIRNPGDPAPTFANAVEIAQFTGQVYAHPTNPSTTWHLWAKWESNNGVLGQPAGGTNGVVVTTGQDVTLLLDALTGKITEGQLYSTLVSRINLIDGPISLAGSVAARLYTETQARLAADTSLGSSITTLQNADSTQASQITTLQTRATNSESNIINLQSTTASQATTITSLTTRTTTSESNIVNLQSTTASQASSITALTTRTTAAESNISSLLTTTATQATQLSQLSTTTNNNTVALQTEAVTRANADNSLFAQYTVKIDNAGLISGFGLASTANNAAPDSDFGILANTFWISPPAVAQSTAPTSSLYLGYVWLDTSVTPNVKRYYNGTSWGTTPTRIPFVVQTTATTINGVSVPAGVYMDTAFIRDGTITNAKIGNAVIDDAKIANLDAAKITAGTIAADRLDANTITSKVLSVDWAKITNASITSAQIQDAAITTAKIANTIQSTTFTSTAGWQINKAGTATFNEVALRGAINGGVYTGYAWPAAGPSNTGFHLGPSGLLLGNFNNGKYVQVTAGGDFYTPGFNVTNGQATFSGNLSAAGGTFSGVVTGVLMKALPVSEFISGMAYYIEFGVGEENGSGPYYFAGSSSPWYLVWTGTMPAPESVGHRIAGVVTVKTENLAGGQSKDLAVLAAVNYSRSGTTISAEGIASATQSNAYNMTVTVAGSTTGTYATAVPVAILVSGYRSYNRVDNVSGLFWGIR